MSGFSFLEKHAYISSRVKDFSVIPIMSHFPYSPYINKLTTFINYLIFGLIVDSPRGLRSRPDHMNKLRIPRVLYSCTPTNNIRLFSTFQLNKR